MQDRQLYQQILGISSRWEVASVELKLEAGDIHVQLSHAADTTWCCAECGKACSLHDHQPERVWRHLDTCQYQTWAYLKDVLDRVLAGSTDYESLRADVWKQSHPEFVRTYRTEERGNRELCRAAVGCADQPVHSSIAIDDNPNAAELYSNTRQGATLPYHASPECAMALS